MKLKEKKNAKLNQILTNKNNELQLHKSEYDNLKNDLLNEIKNLETKYSEEMRNIEKKHSEEMRNMEKKYLEEMKNVEKKHSKDMEIVNSKIGDLEKENNIIRFKIAINYLHLWMKDQKLENLQELVKQVKSDLNKLSEIEKDKSEGLNETIDMLDNLKQLWIVMNSS